MTTPFDITPFRGQEEGQYFDRKSLWHGRPGRKRPRGRREVRDQITEYVAAFANADGGTLVMGVEDDGEVTGHGYPDDVVDGMLATPLKRLNPPQPGGFRYEHDGQQLLVFVAEAAPNAVMVVGDGFPRRIDDQVVLESEEAINAIKQRGRVESVEMEPCPRVSMDDLDESWLVRAARAGGLAGLSPAQYLVHRRLADYSGPNLVLRQGAVLLFAAKPHFIEHPNAGIRIFLVDGVERLPGARHNVQAFPWIDGALPQAIEQAYSVLSGLIRRSTRLHDLFFRETPEYPTFAWQEAVVNAVAHRDYREQGRCVEVWLFDDRMEVVSPGGLPLGVDLRRLLSREHVHVSRNPRITRVLAELNLMRAQGEGIPRMFDEMEQSWLPLPRLEEGEHSFRVTLRNEPIFEMGDPAWVARVRSLPINQRQQRVLVAHPEGFFASGDYQSLNQVDRDTAYREQAHLVERGFLEPPARKGRGARYRVVSEAIAGGEGRKDASPKGLLAASMAREGSIRSKTYQEAMGVSRQRASRELSRLVEQGVLIPEGERGGRRYLRGPGWDTWTEAAQ